MSAVARRSQRRAGRLGIALVGAALIHLMAFWPGIMVWDAIRQYGQALTGRYDDWHPPAMNWLWRQLLPIAHGPAPMLVLQVALYWGGLGLLARAAWLQERRWAALAVVGCGLLPMWLVLIATVLKDSLMAGCLLMAAGLIAQPGPGRSLNRLAIVLFLLAASALRFNAVAAVVPLALAALPPPWVASRGRAVLAAALIGGASLAVIPVANHLLHARRSGVELSLIIYDLGGITRFSGTDVFPPLRAVHDPVAVNAACYTTVSWDRYAWWGPEPCAIGFDGVRAAFARRGAKPERVWAAAVAAHPLAYAQHRIAHFNRNIRLWTSIGDLPALSFRSDPNPWNFAVAPTAASAQVEEFAGRMAGTPAGRPAAWIVLGLAALFVWPRPSSGGIARALLASGLLYSLSFLPLSVASEVRYHLWTMLALALGSILAVGERQVATGSRRPGSALPVSSASKGRRRSGSR